MPARSTSSSRLHVLVVSHMFPRDERDTFGLFVREQVEALAEFADVSVAVGRPAGTSQSVARCPDCLAVEAIELPRPSLLPSSAAVAWSVPAYVRGAREIARRSRRPVDIVHAHFGYPDGVVGVRLARLLGVPSVVTLHGSDFNRQMSRPVVGSWMAKQVAAADLVVACNVAILEGMRTRFGVDEDRSLFLPNGYNDREIHVHAERAPRHFLFVGGLLPGKNPDRLVEAYAQVAEKVGLDLVLVGDGPMRQSLESRVRELGIAQRVQFKGQLPHAELDALLAEAAALVLPSVSEGMPIAVNEALASGTPVIASRLPGTQLQVHSDELGILVPMGNIDALSDAMAECASRRWDYARIAETSGVLTWRGYAQRLDEHYRRLVAAGDAS